MATASNTGARRPPTRKPDAARPRDVNLRVRTEARAPQEGPRLSVSIDMAQIARVVTGLLWVGWAAWTSAVAYVPLASAIETIVAALGLGVIAAALLVRSDSACRRLDRFLLMGSVGLVVVLPLSAAASLGYLTDELAFDQAAAASVLHGINPYTVDFTPALHSFGVGAGTMTLHGSLEPYVTYPALSFLLYLPAVAALGAHSYAGWLVNVLAWGAAGGVMWRVLDERLRPWVPVLLTLPAILGSVIAGATDSLFVPLEIIAMSTWMRFTDPHLGRGWRWAGPICLGLACCVKQQPWLLVPFVLIGVSFEAHRHGRRWWRDTARYAALAAVAFLVPNLPFIAWDPGAWLQRLVAPFTSALVPMGIGPSGLLRPLALGGGLLVLFSVAAVAALVAAAALLCARYDRMRRLLPLLAAAPLFFSTRSFASYFTFCIPALVVNAAALPVTGDAARSRLFRPLMVTSAVAALASVCAAAAAVAVHGPLRVEVAAARATPATLTVVARVTNAGASAVAPNFFVSRGSYYDQVVTKTAGPGVLAAGTSATYQFTTPETPMTPHSGDVLQLQAATLSPDTITASPVVTVSG